MTAQREQRVFPKQTVAVALAALLFLFLLPLLMLPGEGEPPQETQPLPTATLPGALPSAGEVGPVAGWDRDRSLRFLAADGTVETMTMEDYLWGVVAAEMPASFAPEALKAQAVCARTYCVYQSLSAQDKHPSADVCGDPTCCQAYLAADLAAEGWGAEAQRCADKITQAVADTDGLLCLYNGAPIDAVFFSSAAGKTSDAVEVWGTDVPYLTSVDSPEGEEVPGWRTVAAFPLAEARERILAAWPQAKLDQDPAAWFSAPSLDASGGVARLTVGGVEATGVQVRSAFGLRSTHFTVEAGEDNVVFQVTGYGHGVGLSQYGANALAAQGKDFREILNWYYTGITVSSWNG